VLLLADPQRKVGNPQNSLAQKAPTPTPAVAVSAPAPGYLKPGHLKPAEL